MDEPRLCLSCLCVSRDPVALSVQSANGRQAERLFRGRRGLAGLRPRPFTSNLYRWHLDHVGFRPAGERGARTWEALNQKPLPFAVAAARTRSRS